ncbi:MAG: TatD family hydrolase [Acidobacteria bacterium]|nr:TatD family hydrolase [Acidobacteriota bacterium]
MDFHCHLDLYPDAKRVYVEALRRTEFIWAVTTSPRAFAATSKVFPAAQGLYISPGLHPEVADKKASELELLLSQLESCAGVGEIGLDGSTQYKYQFELQILVFRSVVQRCVELGGRVLNIHSRAAAREILDILEANPGFGSAVMHWFTDSPTQLRRAVELGCWFSVGPAMISSANGQKLSALMPRERVVSESDGPFAKVHGTPVMPWEADTVAAKLAQTWDMPAEDASKVLRSNGLSLARLLGMGTLRSPNAKA